MSKCSFVMCMYSLTIVCRGWWRCVLLAVLWLWAVVAVAQPQIEFQVVATPTSGTCYSDGALRAEVVNSTAEEGTLYQYRLMNKTTGVTGTPVRTTDKTYTYTNVVIGDYQVEVVAMTRGSVTRYSPEVSVTSTFVPPVVQMDNENSRYSFACGTGRIVLNITGGRSIKDIKIASGPMRVGETIDYTKTNDTTYQLEGETWLPGTYSIEVTDESCNYTAQTAVTLQELSAFALEIDYNHTDGSLRFYNGDGNCNRASVFYRWDYFRQTNRLSSHYYKYIEMGMIEVGILLGWEDASTTQWFPLTSSFNVSFTLPYNYKEYYEKVNAARWKYAIHYFRLKNCPDIKAHSTSSANAIKTISHSLSGVNYSFSEAAGYASRVLCPPVTATMRRKSDNQLLGEAVLSKKDGISSRFSLAPELFVNKTPVVVSYSDAEGLGGEDEFVLSFNWSKSSERVIAGDCDRFNYTMSFQFIFVNSSGTVISSSGAPNSEVEHLQEVCIYNSQGVLLERRVLDPSTPVPNRRALTFALPEGERFTLKYLYHGVWYEEAFQAASKKYAHPSLSISPDDEQLGYSELYAALGERGVYGPSKQYIPAGSVVTLIAPNGEELARREYRRGTFEGGILDDFGGMKQWPRGEYTLRFYNSCTGQTEEVKEMCYGGHNILEFTYTMEYECGEAYVVPRAKFLDPSNGQIYEYGFFFIHQKNGAVEEVVIEAGQRIRLSAGGDYILSLSVNPPDYEYLKKLYNAPKASDRRLLDIVVHYDGVESLTIDERQSLQYACGPGQEGLILLKAKNGKRPYTYTLYPTAEDRERDENIIDRKTEYDYEAYFPGTEGQHYYVKVVDDCGASYSYDFVLQDISNISMTYVYPKRGCYGAPVELSMLGPENFRNSVYARWYDPQGNMVHEGVDYVIDNVTTEQAGRYKLEFTVPMCSNLYEAYVDLQVDMPVNMGTVPTHHYTACLGRSITIIGPELSGADEEVVWEQAFAESFAPGADVTDPNAEMRYAWSNGMLRGNTRTKDYRTCFATPGTYVLRPVAHKGACTYEGEPIFVKVKRCTVPINPHLMHNATIDWTKFDKEPTNMAR